MDPRLARTQPEPADGEADPRDGARLTSDNGGAEYRDDLDRIRFSPYFSRLAAVTQVVSQGAAGAVVHNRLTHTIKVTAVARAIATMLQAGPERATLDRLGGCDRGRRAGRGQRARPRSPAVRTPRRADARPAGP